jgi:hypothetical protein
VGESNYKLNSGNSLKMKDILYVPSLKKNLLSISALEKKGYRVAFIDGEVLMWAKGETINEAIIIGSEENGLYRLKGHSETAMAHAIENSCELWHRILSHINYKALPYICKVVTGLPELKVDHEGICMLDTPTTLRGGVNECGALFPKTSLLHKNSSISIQHLFITHCCHL